MTTHAPDAPDSASGTALLSSWRHASRWLGSLGLLFLLAWSPTVSAKPVPQSQRQFNRLSKQLNKDFKRNQSTRLKQHQQQLKAALRNKQMTKSQVQRRTVDFRNKQGAQARSFKKQQASARRQWNGLKREINYQRRQGQRPSLLDRIRQLVSRPSDRQAAQGQAHRVGDSQLVQREVRVQSALRKVESAVRQAARHPTLRPPRSSRPQPAVRMVGGRPTGQVSQRPSDHRRLGDHR
ncbi:MAG: hypothetical protein AAF533_12890 [Acidobacteriota bacterium]